MPTNSDTGLASMVSNAEEALTILIYMGTEYEPAPAHMKIPALQAQLADVKALFNDVSNGESALDVVVNKRAVDFDPLPERVMRANNMLDVLSPKSPVKKSAAGHLRKLRGKRATEPALNPDGTPAPKKSVSETTYSSKVQTLTDFINDLESDPLYVPAPPKPNSTEPDLTTAGLSAYRDQLSAHNAAVNNVRTALNNSRAARNAALFDKYTGLRAVYKQVKAYVKARFGTKSPQYQQIKGLKI